jgi:hypothetical protein
MLQVGREVEPPKGCPWQPFGGESILLFFDIAIGKGGSVTGHFQKDIQRNQFE